MARGHRTSATVLALLGAATVGTALTLSVAPVSAEVATAPSPTIRVLVGRPAGEELQRSPIVPLPSPCTTQARRLSETQAALAVASGPSSLIEAEDAALIAQVLIEQCGWTPADTVIGRF